MKAKGMSYIWGLAALATMCSAETPTLEECANAYAFIHIVSNAEVMGGSRNVELYSIKHTPSDGEVLTAISIKYSFYNCLEVYTEESSDMGISDPWILANRTQVYGSIGEFIPLGIPYFYDYLGGMRTSFFSSTNNVMFYRVRFNCTSLDYYSESEVLNYCTNNLSFPSSLFE